ncbi:MAG: hypothetical protein UH084_07535 [Paludibacteraceae bacterium]|nr:hypothetical protein [Paludibacteraceae bacterium]
MRTLLDKILRAGIKVLMLTGITFTVTACYAPPPHGYYNPPEQEDLEQRVLQAASSTDEVASAQNETE